MTALSDVLVGHRLARRGLGRGGPQHPRGAHHRRPREARPSCGDHRRCRLRADARQRGARLGLAKSAQPRPEATERLVAEVRSLYDAGNASGREPVLVVASVVRPALARLFAVAIPRLVVMSVNEIGRQVQLDRIGVVNGVPAEASV